ncbi:hypothetical protein [Nannocystis punicea]|uniref:Uncharacterized protein n=1 Tax=Nannocystis punicea TaxID=2995304 RepID=A0ABY7HB73_9BACT|nr:hypothetical protein [Nannocystis poenicansa]WAS96264.1 hypothetical protein O0S08_08880 [Nannocystis poenicansa]
MTALRTLLAAALSTALTLPTPALAAPAPAPAPAASVDWSSTFTPGGASAHLGDKKPNIIVIAANPGSQAAAATFRAALTASKKAGVVLDGQALGAVDSLDDRAIIERAKVLPVQQIVIVRVFEGSPGDPPSFIAMGYGADGNVAVALSGTAGVPLPEPELPTEVSVPEPAVDAASDAPKAPEESEEAKQARDVAENEYAAKRLGGTWGALRQGTPGTPITPTQFYAALGRDDLARQVDKRKKTRLGVALGGGIAGGGLLAVGLTFLILNSTATKYGPDFGPDDPLRGGTDRVRYPLSMPLSGALLGVGAALLIGMGVFLGVYKAHPVGRRETPGLIDGHNRELRKKLGLPPEQASVRLAPSLGASNGLVLFGRF